MAINQRIGMTAKDARASARLGLAVARGLLLDLLATGDRAGTDAAMKHFLTSYMPLTGTTKKSGSVSMVHKTIRSTKAEKRPLGSD